MFFENPITKVIAPSSVNGTTQVLHAKKLRKTHEVIQVCPWLVSFWINTHLAVCFIVLISFFLFFLWSSIYFLCIISSLIWVCLLNFTCMWTFSCWDLRNIHVQILEIHLVSLPFDSLEAPWQWTHVFSKVKGHCSFHVKSYLIYPRFSYISLSIQIFNL